MVQGRANRSPETAISSGVKDKNLLSWDNCSRLYCGFASVYINYKIIKSTYINVTTGAGH
jgi:hypothetical protein